MQRNVQWNVVRGSFLILVDSLTHLIQIKILLWLKAIMISVAFLTDSFFASLFCVQFSNIYDVIWN